MISFIYSSIFHKHNIMFIYILKNLSSSHIHNFE